MPAVGDVIYVAVLIEITDSGVLALAVFLKFDEVGPWCPDLLLARVEEKAAVSSFLEVYEYVLIAIAIPVVVVETVRAVIVRIRLNDIDAPSVGPWLARVFFLSVFVFSMQVAKEEDARKCDESKKAGSRVPGAYA